MGFMDTVKGWFSGNKDQVKSGIDKASDAGEKAVGQQHAAKVEAVGEKAKDAVDKLGGPDTAPGQAAAPPTTPPPAAPPAP